MTVIIISPSLRANNVTEAIVVLLHGWGMHGGLWGKFNELLSENCQTHAIDLPGFGFSKDIKNEFTLDAITAVVEDYIKQLNK